jgi:hypothetical protein
MQVHGSKIATSEERVANWKILVHQWRNEPSFRDQLGHHLAFTKAETAGEVMFAGASTLTNEVFKRLSNVNRAYFGIRQQ